MKETEIKIEGMSCGHCSAALRGQWERFAGVTVLDVRFGSARIRCDETGTGEAVNAAVEKAGFKLVS